MIKLIPQMWRYALVASLCLSHAVAGGVSIFDGKTLEGWESPSPELWKVQDGAITGGNGQKIKNNDFLATRKSYQNFELKLKIKLTGDPKTGMLNSGIQIRSMREHNGHLKGYQCDYGEPKWYAGIYDEGRRNKFIAPADMATLKPVINLWGWNDYVIRAEGKRIRTWINGVAGVDFTETDENIASDGIIGIQVHSGGDAVVQVKDITIEELPPSPELPTWGSLQGKVEKPATAPGSAAVEKPKDGRPEVVFADFEDGTYKGWTLAGTAFGERPLKKNEVPGYQGDLGMGGDYCVNSHASAKGGPSDKATGSLTSAPFAVTRAYIGLKLGGGSVVGKTCVNLLVDGKVVASVTGSDRNRMEWKTIPTKQYEGKQAQLQIVDEVSSGWGNIGVDDIVFTDQSSAPAAKAEVKPVTKAEGKPGSIAPAAAGAKTPEEQLACFKLAEGFVIELVASEKDGVINPIDLNFDDAGRLWTQTARMYPLDPDPDIKWNDLLKLMDNPAAQQADPRFRKVLDLYQGKEKGEDKVLILPEPHKGAQGIMVWAEGLTIPQSVLPYKDGAFVAQGSELIFLRDSDGDGKADSRESIISGLGYTDTHTMVHLLTRAPGSWVHFSQGALNKGMAVMTKSGAKARLDFSKIGRFSLDGTRLQLINSGLNNIWGISLRDSGQWYGMEANDMGFSIVPMEIGTGYTGIGNEKLHPSQPLFPAIHSFRVGGTGLSGHAFADDAAGSFPAEWRDVAFLVNPITNTINAVQVVRNADGTVNSKHLPDLLQCSDPWFRPVRSLFGPDGCLYVADWYNKIVSHNEVARSHPDRDKTHGRIWRIRHVSQKPREIPDFYKVKDADLPGYLKSPSIWAKRAAWHQIVDRKSIGLAPQLVEIAGDSKLDDATRITSLWCLMELRHFDAALMSALMKSPKADVRREAVLALSSMPITPEQLHGLLVELKEEQNPMVRSQVLRTLADFGRTNPALIRLLVSYCGPELPAAAGGKGEKLGGPYERKFERYLALKALESYPSELASYLDSVPNEARTENDLWAARALSGEAQVKTFLTNWQTLRQKPLDAEGLKAVCALLRTPAVLAAVKPVFEADDAGYLVELAMANRNEVLSAPLSGLLSVACGRLLSSADSKQVQLGVLAADRLRVPKQEAAIESILRTNPESAAVFNSAVNVLARNPAGRVETLEKALGDKRLSPSVAVAVLAGLVKVDAAAAERQAGVLAKRLDLVQQANLVNQLSASGGGCKILLALLEAKQLPDTLFDLALAERLKENLKGVAGAGVLYERRLVELKAQKQETAAKLAKFMKLAGKRGGDPSKGRPLFQAVCLGCHVVGTEGAAFAPALDGSAFRDDEGLLTAILDPDVAVEGGYSLYRIIKEDGSVLEGYLSKNEPLGATLRFMGGASVFVPAAEILSAEYLPSRSVMPRGLIDSLGDSEVENLLAYIRTLKK